MQNQNQDQTTCTSKECAKELGKEKAHQEIAKEQGHTQFMKDHPEKDKNCEKDCLSAHQHNWPQQQTCEKECKTSHQHNWPQQQFCEKECKTSHQHHFATDVSHNRVEEHEKMDKNIKDNLETEKKIKEEQYKIQKEKEEENRKKFEKEMERAQAKEEAQREMNMKIAKKGGHEPSKIAGFADSAIGSVTEAFGHLVGDVKIEEKGKILKEEGKAELEASKYTDTAKANAHKVAGFVAGHINQTQPIVHDKDRKEDQRRTIQDPERERGRK
jgi:uncharacterized protein YjbJ (UPF0337 family)